MNVALHLPRNMKTTSITTSRVIRMVSLNEPMVLTMLSEESMTVDILMSEGSEGATSASFSFTPLITFTVFEPVCLVMAIMADFMPLVKDSWDFSCGPSKIVATSLKYTRCPFDCPTTTSSISLGSLNSFSTLKV